MREDVRVLKNWKKNQLLSTNHHQAKQIWVLIICAQQLIFLQFFNTRASSRTISFSISNGFWYLYIYIYIWGGSWEKVPYGIRGRVQVIAIKVHVTFKMMRALYRIQIIVALFPVLWWRCNFVSRLRTKQSFLPVFIWAKSSKKQNSYGRLSTR